MPETKEEIILTQDGKAVWRRVEEWHCNVTQKLADEAGKGVVRVIKNAGEVADETGNLPYHLLKTGTELYAIVPLRNMVLNTRWSIGVDKILRPLFVSEGENPVMKMVWPASAGMLLVFAARLLPQSNGGYQIRSKESCYLMALDSKWNNYLLPLPNLYTTGYLCMGDFDGLAMTVNEALTKAFRQFRNSQWNADLITGSRQEGANKMMAFNASGKEPQPIPYDNWAKILERCESPAIEQLKGVLR